MGKIKLLIVIILVPLFLTSCWDKVEIEDKAMILALGIDLEENLFGLSYAVGNEAKSSGEGKDEKTSTPSEGSDINTIKAVSLHSANSVFMRESPRQPNFEHLKVIIIGEKLYHNKGKFEEILIEMEKEYEIARTVLVFTTVGKASDVMALEKNIKGPIGLYLREIIENNGEKIHVKPVMLDELLCEIGAEVENLVELPNIYIKDEKPIVE